jgi:hypothetical protein
MRRKPRWARVAGPVALATAVAGCATVGPDCRPPTGFCRKFYNWLNPVEKTEQAYAANG